MAVFVMDQRHWHVGTAQRLQRVHRVNLIGDNRRLSHQGAQVDRAARNQDAHDIARLDDADDPID